MVGHLFVMRTVGTQRQSQSRFVVVTTKDGKRSSRPKRYSAAQVASEHWKRGSSEWMCVVWVYYTQDFIDLVLARLWLHYFYIYCMLK